jgi:Carboxypeptidase regulatory-like domain
MLSGTVPLDAQINSGTVLGTVTDTSGAPASGVELTLTNGGTNAILTTMTASDGSYKFAPVGIGVYKLLASLQGFKQFHRVASPLMLARLLSLISNTHFFLQRTPPSARNRRLAQAEPHKDIEHADRADSGEAHCANPTRRRRS